MKMMIRMVHVKFFALLRSNHRVSELSVEASDMKELTDEILLKVPSLSKEELKQAVIFINNKKVMHEKRFNEKLEDGDVVVFTNFVGGG